MRNMGFESGGAILWLLQRVTGLTLAILLTVHIVITHYQLPESGLTYGWVAERLSQPGWKAFYLFFLILALYHGLNGAWIIVQDYIHRDGLRITLLSLFMMVGIFLLSVGSLTIFTFIPRG